ncbi:MAG TPA: hypothetical protein VN946_07160 [Terriglobales bacterium]|nr:hypothetical protein [Terriglobales bacterium]
MGTGFTVQRQAQDLLNERLAQVSKGEWVARDKTPVTVASLFYTLADWNKTRGKDKENSLRRRRAHLDPFFAGVMAANVTTDLVARYTLQRQAQKAANATINRELATLRRAQPWAAFNASESPHRSLYRIAA